MTPCKCNTPVRFVRANKRITPGRCGRCGGAVPTLVGKEAAKLLSAFPRFAPFAAQLLNRSKNVESIADEISRAKSSGPWSLQDEAMLRTLWDLAFRETDYDPAPYGMGC